MKKLFLFLPLLILTHCGLEKLQNAAGEVAKVFKAKNISVGKSFKANTQDGKVKTISLTLEDVEAIEKNNVPMKSVASVSAKIFSDNLTAEDLGDTKKIVVIIKSNGNTSEFLYALSDLQRMDDYIKALKLYLTDVKNRNYDALVTYLDTSRLSVTDHLSMIQAYKQNDSIMGQQDSIVVTGFDFSEVKTEVTTPVVEVWAEMRAKGYMNRYHFYFNNDGKEVKVLAIGMNDEMNKKD